MFAQNIALHTIIGRPLMCVTGSAECSEADWLIIMDFFLAHFCGGKSDYCEKRGGLLKSNIHQEDRWIYMLMVVAVTCSMHTFLLEEDYSMQMHAVYRRHTLECIPIQSTIVVITWCCN